MRPTPVSDVGPIRERILVVDDDEQLRALLAYILEREGYRCTLAQDAAHAREALQRAPYDLIVCDVTMPGESGLDLVEDAVMRHERMAALMVSGLDDVALAERALRIGAYGYVVKPFSINDVLIAVLGALRHRRAATQDPTGMGEDTIRRLCVAVEARDVDTAAHIARMSEHCWQIARELGLPREHCDLLRTASPMHDVGKVGVPDEILRKPGPLTGAERSAMQLHAEIGYRILAGSRSELLQIAAQVAWTHHERHDGAGYPRRLAGEQIPLDGRIASVADVYDALTRDRVYRPRLPHAEATRYLIAGRGTAFDPSVLDAFLAIVERDFDTDQSAAAPPAAPTHQASRFERHAATPDRGSTAAMRARATAHRLVAADHRDHVAQARDLNAAARDKTAAERDRAADVAPGERAVHERAMAAEDRAAAAADRQQAAEDRRHAGLDELTGVSRRGTGELALTREIARSRRTQRPLILALIDIDALKHVNDVDGHAAGDALLRDVATATTSIMRAYDVVVRWGGDEFVCALSDATLDVATTRISAIQRALDGLRDGASISAGLAELNNDDDLEALISRADDALYRAKRRRATSP
jgi:cyclic di-GMP phosphodiesterase